MIIICLLVLFLTNNSYTQGCCGIGGSLVSGGYPVLNKNTVLVSTSGNYAEAKNPDRHRGGPGVLLAYGITDRLSLSLKTSYAWARSSIYQTPIKVSIDSTIPGKTVNSRNNGFGDGYAAVQFALIRLTPMNKQELITGLDVGIPWGPDRATVVDTAGNENVLPGSVQTGTGGYSMNGFLTYLKAFPETYYSVTSTIAGRVQLGKTRNGTKLGDEFSVMVTSLFGPFFDARGSITFSYYQNGMAYNENRYVDPAEKGTPGKRFSLVPALEYSISSNLKLSINTDIPLWRDYNQSLYGNNKVLRADIYWFIHLPDTSPQIKTILK